MAPGCLEVGPGRDRPGAQFGPINLVPLGNLVCLGFAKGFSQQPAREFQHRDFAHVGTRAGFSRGILVRGFGVGL